MAAEVIPVLKIEYLPIKAIAPYKRNARTHSEVQVGQIAASITEFGFTNPILIDEDNGLIAGHGRLLAAIKLGMAELPAVRLGGLSEAQRRALVIADNKLAMNAGWDLDLLKGELVDLDLAGFDLSLIGFSDLELGALLADKTAGLTDPDDVPDVAEPVSVLGDVWVLGNHRLVCGDCTDIGVVESACGGTKAHICVTDPPYGVGFDYNAHKDTKENLVGLIDGFVPIMRSMCQTVLITPGNSNQRRYPEPDWTLCWFCSAGVGRGPWGFTCWQPILAYGKDPFLKMGKGSRPDGFESNEGKPKNVNHSCPKPVGVWQWIMDRADPTGCATFIDPFMGSGTTIIVSEMTGRSARGIELDPVYVDVAVRRWQAFTGKDAVLEATGEKFSEVESCRTKKAA